MKKQLILMGLLASTSLFASKVESNVEAYKWLNSNKETGTVFAHRTNLELEMPHDLVLKADLIYFSDFDYRRFTLEHLDTYEIETGIGLTKKFGKYGDISVDVKLDKTARLGYHNRYQLNELNKVYGGLEYEHKFINQKRGLKVFYEKNNLAKYDNHINYSLMANSGKVYLGLESKLDTKFGKFDSDVKLSDTIQYDKVETLYKDEFDGKYKAELLKNYFSGKRVEVPTKKAHKKVFSNQTELETKHKFTFAKVPVSVGLDTKTNVLVGRFNGDAKQDVLDIKSTITPKVEYTYKKDDFTVRPELAIENVVNVNKTVKYDIPFGYKIVTQNIEKLEYNLILKPAINAEYNLGQGLVLNGKAGIDVNFYKLETELNKESQKGINDWHDFGYNYTKFRLGAGLTYIW